MSKLSERLSATFSQIANDIRSLITRVTTLEENGSGGGGSNSIVLDRKKYTNSMGVATFACVYTVPHVRVYVDGQKLPDGYTAVDGTSITLDTPLISNDQVVEIEAFSVTLETETNPNFIVERRTYKGVDVDGKDTFSVNYKPPYVDVFVNGSYIPREDYTATNGSAVILTQPLTIDDIVDLKGMSPHTVTEVINRTISTEAPTGIPVDGQEWVVISP